MIHSTVTFDTRFDTNKFFVPMKTKFIRRDYVNREGLSPVYIHISSNGRERMMTNILVIPKYWDEKTQRVTKAHKDAHEINLMLDNISARITKIKTVYHLSSKALTPKILIEELRNTTPRTDFIIFFAQALERDRSTISHGAYRRYKAVLSKLKQHHQELLFSEIDYKFIDGYRQYLSSFNKATTVNSNLRVIKKYLIAAERMGVKYPLDLSYIKIGKTTGNRIDLGPHELKKVYEYYKSPFINQYNKLILGYFLFSCFTGLRWQTVRSISRSDIIGVDYLNLEIQKTNKRQSIPLNDRAKEIVNECEDLFVEWKSDIYINRALKNIMNTLGIKKKVSFHVARHTFATNFLRVGGNVVKLQLLLGHSNIRETMIYVHIIEQEANKEVKLLDSLF